MDTQQPYDYTTAGFNDFLVRSLDSVPTSFNLATLPANASTGLNYDLRSVGGSLGDVLTIGKIELNGTDGVIRLRDKSGNEVLAIGDPQNPGQFTIKDGGLYAYDKDGNPTIVNSVLVGNRNLASVSITTVAGNILGTSIVNFDQEMLDTNFILWSTHLRFTVPAGVSKIRLTLSSSTTADGLSIHEKALSTTDQTLNAANRLFEIQGGTSVYATRVFTLPVKEGDIKDIFVAANSAPGTESMTVSSALPFTFSADIP